MKENMTLRTVESHQIWFILLIIFCAFRPITLINPGMGILGFNILEIFAIVISYLMLIAVLLNIKKVEFDLVTGLIFLFCSYCVLSLIWGSKLRTVSQIILPFVVFMAMRLFIRKRKEIDFLLIILIISYIIPLFGSFIEIIRGTSVSLVESLTGIERHSGLFSGIRSMASSLFFFSMLFYLKVNIFKVEKKILNYVLLVMLMVSVFCIVKSYTRSILIGLFLFWAIALIGNNKKNLLVFFVLAIIFGFFYQDNLKEIFFKKQEFEIQTASSGRSFIWAHNINLYKNYYVYEKLIGRGLGVGSKGVIGEDWEVWSSHNDYLHLLMHLGGVGLILYMLIHFAILKEILNPKFDKKTRNFYLAFFLSIIFINFSSGIITYQLSTAQIFWTIMAFHLKTRLSIV